MQHVFENKIFLSLVAKLLSEKLDVFFKGSYCCYNSKPIEKFGKTKKSFELFSAKTRGKFLLKKIKEKKCFFDFLMQKLAEKFCLKSKRKKVSLAFYCKNSQKNFCLKK